MVNINIQKKDLYLLAAIMVFLVGVGYVIAIGSGDYNVHGHDAGEIEGSTPTIAIVNGNAGTTYNRNHNGLVLIEAHYVGYNAAQQTISVNFLVNGVSKGGFSKGVNYIVMPSPTFSYLEVMSGPYTFRVDTTNLEQHQLQFVITEY